jgi:hypothetical protein
VAAPDPHRNAALAALTAAALALPGLAAPAHAADSADEFNLDVRHYDEGERNLNNQTYGELNLKPLHADSLSVGLKGGLTDRVKFGFDYTQDTWSGATPVATVPEAAIADQISSGASRPQAYSADSQHRPVDVNWSTFDGSSVQSTVDQRLVHVMGSASPETRRQGEAHLSYEWNQAAVGVGGGLSVEPDYHSDFVNIDGRLDLDSKLTTLSWSASYTSSDIHASLEANNAADWGAYLNQIADRNGVQTLYGHRTDKAFALGLSRVLNKDAVISAGVGYTRSAGYLSNPYKAVVLAFDDPDQFIDSTGLRTVVLHGVLEQRPTLRNQWNFNLDFVQYVAPFDASLHLGYRFFRDDWGVNAHTLDASWHQPLPDGWMLTPGVRYYSQSKAFFYQPYFLFDQAFPILFPRNPELPPKLDFSQLKTQVFSSDQRLSGFGSITGRLALAKSFPEGFRVEFGGEFTRHAGSLKLGGGGEGAFADYSSYTLYTALKVDLDHRAYASEADHAAAVKAAEDVLQAPAGVFFADMLDKRGQVSIAFRHDYARRNGPMLFGSEPVGDQAIIDNACGADNPCQLTPMRYTENISTLQLMVGATDWLTVLLQPTLIDRHMDVRPLVPDDPGGFLIGGPGGGCCLGGTTPNYRRSTGGLGDTGVYALARIWGSQDQRLQLGLGLIAPTGNPGVLRDRAEGYYAYPLQLGRGVWALQPSITWIGRQGRFTWGAQVMGIKRLEGANTVGYAPGDEFHGAAWAGYRPFDWLTGTLRLERSVQNSTSGAFGPHDVPTVTGYKYVGNEQVAIYSTAQAPQIIEGPQDTPQSQGGRSWDLGLGLSAVVPVGPFAGQRFSVEWRQPLADHVYGYQLARTGTLTASWSVRL